MSLSDVELAARLASSALALLRTLRDDRTLTGRELGRAGDEVANAFLVRALRSARPDDGLLSEEEVDDGTRLDHHRVWIIDPLDGTAEYSQGRDDWAVHVALCEGDTVSAAAVAELSGTRSTQDPGLGPANPVRQLMVSRTRAPEVATRAAAAIGATLVPRGSAGAKVMAVVRGEAAAYVHAGLLAEWDAAAPVGVALAAGLHCSRLDGRDVVFNQQPASLEDLLVCRPELADALLAACR